MLRVIGCFTTEHDFRLVLAAAFICMLGSALTVRLFMRARNANGVAVRIQITLTGIVGGGMIWATHFVAMLAYDPAIDHGYEPILTGVSLLVAILGVTLTVGLASLASFRYAIELGGALFGMTVVAMHYIGMSAYLISGVIVWDTRLWIASVLLAVLLGIIAFNRVARPVTRYCWLGGTAGMVLTICVMHFTGMGAITIELDPTIVVPPNPLKDTSLAVIVMACMGVVLLMGVSAFMIEERLMQDTRNRLRDVTQTDPLTGLPNRLHLQGALRSRADQMQLGLSRRVAVLTVNLNMFKQINDMHGHAAGDAALATIADRFKMTLGTHEYIARSGGDEFVAIKHGFQRQEEVMAFANRLRAQVMESITYDGRSLSVGVSIGISSAPEDGDDILCLQENSDIAMYRAKQDGYSSICVFEAQMYEADRGRTALKADLQVALADTQFELNYQLQNDIKTHAPVGFEVLLRWNHPTRGRVSPNEFIPIAEETGLICDIGIWVLRTACVEAASWEVPYRVAVNVAPQQLVQPTFVEQVADILMESRLDSKRLELEITEASIIDDQSNTLDVIHRLKSMGVRIAMDDFGTGYSSLATLQTFPFDKIKIDRSFVTGVHNDPKRAAIIRATIMIGEAMNIPVLAEGVEEAEELAFLLAENCKEVQGFYFGKPLNYDQMREIAAPASSVRQAS